MNELDEPINIEEHLNKHPEYRLLTDFECIESILSYEKYHCDSNHGAIMDFILENEEVFQGEDFTDVLNFTIFNFISCLENTNSKVIFIQVFRNLKIYVSINMSNETEEPPLFFYTTIYKSLLYMNKLIMDFHKFLKFSNELNIIEILEYMPQLFHTLKFKKSNDILREETINQIKIIYDLFNNLYTSYDVFKKAEIAFYLYRTNPFMKKAIQNDYNIKIIKKSEEIPKINELVNSENNNNNINFTFANQKILNSQKSPNLNSNFVIDNLMFNSKFNTNINLIANPNNLNSSSCDITDVSVSNQQIKNNISILTDCFSEDKDSIKRDEISIKEEKENYENEFRLVSDKNIDCDNKIEIFDNKKNMEGYYKSKKNENQIYHNQNIIYQPKKLSSKVKKFTEYHFDKIKFNKKFLTVFDIFEKDIHLMLENVATNLFYEEKNFCDKEKSNLEFEKLKEEFSKLFNNYTLHLIGSLSCDIYSNLPGRTSIDFLLLPDEKRTETYFPDLSEFLDILSRFNHSNSKYQLCETFSDETQQHHGDYILTNTLYSKNNDKYFNANFFIHKENLKFSNDYFQEIFSICENLKILHVFMQEILIAKIGFCYNRYDITLTILSFLDFYSKILRKEIEIPVSLEYLNPENSENKVVEEYFFYFEISKEKLLELNKINLGELILEFLRYFLNYMTYVKNKYNKNRCKGYEYLDGIFNIEYLNGKTKYLFCHEFVKEFYKLSQEEFINGFMTRFNKLEEIFFIICENSKLIKRYNDITSNIPEIED
jgi:hypothetical protein